MTFSTPFSDDLSIMVFRAGIRDSQPSRPKRFSADHFFCRNSSNLNTHTLRLASTGGGPVGPEAASDRWGVPGGAHHAGQQRPLLLQSELHHTGSLKLLPDPLTLLQVVDEHELHADVLTVRHLSHTHVQVDIRKQFDFGLFERKL